MPRFTANNHQRFLNGIYALLVIVFFVKMSGFFAWSDNMGFTRPFKTVSRITMTVAVYGIYRRILSRGAVAAFAWEQSMSILLYCAYLLLGLVSFFWSTDIGKSALQWVMDFESLIFSYYFICCFILLERFFPGNRIRMYNVIGHSCLGLMAIFVIGMWIAPDTFFRLTHDGEEARLGGFIMNPNELGMLGGVGVSCLLFNLYTKRGRIVSVLEIAVLLYGVVMTGSRSSTIGCLLIGFFHISQSSNWKLKMPMYAGAFAVVPFAISKVIVKQGGMDEVMSMTGRLPFWKALITEGLPREILLGFGFQRINYTDKFGTVHTYSASMTHNTFVQALMNLGFIGFTIVMLQLMFTLRGFFHTAEKEKRLMLFGILLPVIINSFTEFGIFGETNYGILFYQILIFYICITTRERLVPAEKKLLLRFRPDLVSGQAAVAGLTKK